MADLNEKVILEVNLDTTQVNDSLVVVKGNIESVKKKLKEIETQKTAFASQGKDVTDLNKQIVVLQSSLRGLNTEQKNLQRQVDLNTRANQAAKGSYEELLRNYTLAETKLKTLGGTIEQNANGQFELTAEFHKQSAAVGAAREAINKFNLTLNNGSTNTGNYKKSLEGLKFAHERINKSASGIASVFSVLAITQGEDSKATQLQRNAMLALTAVQEISNIRMGIANTLIGAQSIRTALLTGATRAQTIGQGILNAVTSLFPGAALVLAITAIVQVVGQWLGKTDELTAKQKEQNAELERTKKLIEDSTKSFNESIDKLNSDDTNKKIISNLETQIQLARIRGATITELFQLESNLLNKQIDMYRNARKTDSVEYNDLLNKKKALTAQYYVDLKELADKQPKAPLVKDIQQFKEVIKTEADFMNSILFDTENKFNESQDRMTKKVKDELDKRIDGERDAAQLKRDLEIQIANSLFELDQAVLDNRVNSLQIQSDANIRAIEAQFAAGNITEEQATKQKIKNEQLLHDQVAKLKRKEAISEKEQALFNIALHTAEGVVNYLKNPLTAGLVPFIIALGALQAGIVIAKPIPAFAEGGLSGKRIGSGDGVPIQRSNGDNRLATVRTGEVILNERQQSALGGAETFRRIGVPGFAEGGITAGMLAFADGGFAARQISQPVIDSVQINGVVDAIAGLQIIARISDINAVNGKLIAISDRANT